MLPLRRAVYPPINQYSNHVDQKARRSTWCKLGLVVAHDAEICTTAQQRRCHGHIPT